MKKTKQSKPKKYLVLDFEKNSSGQDIFKNHLRVEIIKGKFSNFQDALELSNKKGYFITCRSNIK